MKAFEALGVEEEVLAAVKKLGFYEPTPVQTATIPLILAGKDVIAGSNTGSGKTFAFGAGIIQRIYPQGGIQALILVPTRELAEQILQTFKLFCKESPIKVAAVYGGVALGPQYKAVKNAEILIGTPGRLLDHLERSTLRLDRLNHVVLDEADRMLDMGFLPDVKRILKQCPMDKQVLLFSATMPPEIKRLSQQFMRNPEQVNLAEQVDPKKLSQETYLVNNKAKIDVLAHLLKEEHEKELSIVFCNTRSEVDRATKILKKAGIKATAIHGGLSQNQRLRVIKVFNTKNNISVLVCTDVAARGLDIPGISHVYNYDLPREPKQYIHRIGRTARAGADGKAINLVSQRDMGNYRQVLRNNNLIIPQKEAPLPEQRLDPNELGEKKTGGRGRPEWNKKQRESPRREGRPDGRERKTFGNKPRSTGPRRGAKPDGQERKPFKNRKDAPPKGKKPFETRKPRAGKKGKGNNRPAKRQ